MSEKSIKTVKIISLCISSLNILAFIIAYVPQIFFLTAFAVNN